MVSLLKGCDVALRLDLGFSEAGCNLVFWSRRLGGCNIAWCLGLDFSAARMRPCILISTFPVQPFSYHRFQPLSAQQGVNSDPFQLDPPQPSGVGLVPAPHPGTLSSSVLASSQCLAPARSFPA